MQGGGGRLGEGWQGGATGGFEQRRAMIDLKVTF